MSKEPGKEAGVLEKENSSLKLEDDASASNKVKEAPCSSVQDMHSPSVDNLISHGDSTTHQISPPPSPIHHVEQELDSQNINNLEIGEDTADSDPLMIWTAIRPWVALNISCWDLLCDKAKWAEDPLHTNGQNSLQSQTYKLQVSCAEVTSIYTFRGFSVIGKLCVVAFIFYIYCFL